MHPLPPDLKSLFNKVIAAKDDVFTGCTVLWGPYKTCLLFVLFEAAPKLEGDNILDISPEVIFEVAATIKGVEMLRVRDWLDRIIGEIQRECRHCELVLKTETLKKWIEEMKQVNNNEKKLARIETEMITEDMILFSVKNYMCKSLTDLPMLELYLLNFYYAFVTRASSFLISRFLQVLRNE